MTDINRMILPGHSLGVPGFKTRACVKTVQWLYDMPCASCRLIANSEIFHRDLLVMYIEMVSNDPQEWCFVVWLYVCTATVAAGRESARDTNKHATANCA